MDTDLFELELPQDPLARGIAHGEELRVSINEIALHFEEEIQLKSLALSKNPSLSSLHEHALRLSKKTEELSEDLVLEMEGIAKGANIRYEKVALLNGLMDVFDKFKADYLNAGCTCIAYANENNDDAIIGQNFDGSSFLSNKRFVMKTKNGNGDKQAIFAIPGTLGMAGINSSGIAVIMNHLTPLDAGLGVMFPAVLRSILESGQICQAIDRVISKKRAGGINYCLADSNGDVVNLETTANKYSISIPDPILVHTNHYLSSVLLNLEGRNMKKRGESIARWARASRLLRNREVITHKEIFGLLSDHANQPRAICKHEGELDGMNFGETLTGMVFKPSTREAWFSKGKPCEERWLKVSLN